MDYPCGKFGNCSFSRFDSTRHPHTDVNERNTPATLISMSNYYYTLIIIFSIPLLFRFVHPFQYILESNMPETICNKMYIVFCTRPICVLLFYLVIQLTSSDSGLCTQFAAVSSCMQYFFRHFLIKDPDE